MTPPPRAHNLATALPSLGAIGASMISVQIGAAFAKRLFPIIGPQGATVLRVGIAALILVLALRSWRRPVPRAVWPALAGYGVSLGLMNLAFYSALRTIPLGIAVAVEFAGPLGVAVLGSRRWMDFLWIALAATGVVALLPLGGQAHTLDPVGLLLALAAGACWGLYIIFGQKIGPMLGSQATAVGMVIAAAVVSPVGLAMAGGAMFNPAMLASAIGVAILSSVLPYSLEMFALARMPMRVFGVLMSAEPAMAALAGFLLLHEVLSPRQIVAIAAIMAASLGVTLTLRGDPVIPPPR